MWPTKATATIVGPTSLSDVQRFEIVPGGIDPTLVVLAVVDGCVKPARLIGRWCGSDQLDRRVEAVVLAARRCVDRKDVLVVQDP